MAMPGQPQDMRMYGAQQASAFASGEIATPRPTLAMTLEQALGFLGEAEHVAAMIGGALLGPSPSASDKAPSPVGVVSAASEVRNRAQRLVEFLHAIARELA